MDVAGSIAGWVHDVFDQIRSISLPLLLLALALHTCETLLNAFAWRNILVAAYPRGGAGFRPILGAYGGGIALNAILPAQAGTVAMLGLLRAEIRGSTVLGVVGAGVVQNAFFLLVGALVGIVLVVSRPGAFDLKAGWLTNHLLLGVGAVVVVAIVAWVLGRRFRDGLAAAQEGAAILRTPRRYASQVLAVEVASYVVRMAVTTTFMYAYDVPVSAPRRPPHHRRQLDLDDICSNPRRCRHPASAGVGRPAELRPRTRRHGVLPRPAIDPDGVGRGARLRAALVHDRLDSDPPPGEPRGPPWRGLQRS